MKKKSRLKSSPPLEPPQSFAELGDRFVKLGTAMQNPDSKIRDIAGLALSAGLELNFQIRPKSRGPFKKH